MNSRLVANFRPLVPMSSRGSTPFYNLSDPFPRPKPPICAGLSSRVLSLCFGARWVWPRLTLSLGYPPCYPSPVLLASSNASSPHSSSLRVLSVTAQHNTVSTPHRRLNAASTTDTNKRHQHTRQGIGDVKRTPIKPLLSIDRFPFLFFFPDSIFSSIATIV